jgi:AraC-like DNA-binding protein
MRAKFLSFEAMKHPRTTRTEHVISATYAAGLLEVARRWDVAPTALLRGLDVSEAGLSEPSAQLPLPTYLVLLDRARALTGEPGLGVCLGLQMRLSVHGYVGLAAMMSGTLRQTLAFTERFAPTRTTALSLRLVVEDEMASLVFEDHVALGGVRDVLLFALVVGLWQAGRAITGRELRGGANFAFDEPAYFSRFASQLPSSIRFSQPLTEIYFDASELDRPLPMADPAALRLMEEQCTRELEALRLGDGVVSRTRDLVFLANGDVRTIDESARALAMSSRTLKRRLAEHGETYSSIVEEGRKERALRLLRDESLSIEQVAARLGYADPANFTRAFKRWMKSTPKEWRASR